MMVKNEIKLNSKFSHNYAPNTRDDVKILGITSQLMDWMLSYACKWLSSIWYLINQFDIIKGVDGFMMLYI